MNDREKVIDQLNTASKIMHKGYVYLLINPSLRNDAVKLLEEQKAVKPVRNEISHNDWFCGKCGRFVSILDDYCGGCGRPVLWDDEM